MAKPLRQPIITRNDETGYPVMDKYMSFAADLGPTLYREIVNQGVLNPDRAYDYMMRQLAWESNYGNSRVARDLFNYGGYGWNGKTYTTFKSKDDFARAYVKLMNSRYRNALQANDIYGYGRELKKHGYYEDDVDHYTNNLARMNSVSRAAAQYRKTHPDLYTNVNITAPDYNAMLYLPKAVLKIPTTIPQYHEQPVSQGTGALLQGNTELDPYDKKTFLKRILDRGAARMNYLDDLNRSLNL